MGLGFLFLFLSSELKLGTLAKMGPGMYPFIVSCLLIFTSIVYTIKADKNNEQLDLNIVILLKMLGAMFFSILSFKYLGILAAIIVLVPLVSFLHKEWTYKSIIISTVISSIIVIILKFTVLKALPLW